MIGAMCKIHCTEMMFDCVYKCMQVVGVNSVDKKHMFERYLREAAILPLYDAGQLRHAAPPLHGVMADATFNPRAFMDDEPSSSPRRWRASTRSRVRRRTNRRPRSRRADLTPSGARPMKASGLSRHRRDHDWESVVRTPLMRVKASVHALSICVNGSAASVCPAAHADGISSALAASS